MSQDRPWWVVSDPNFQPPQEKAVALDDPQPESAMPAWAQVLHDRMCAVEEWIKAHMPHAETPAPEVVPEPPPAPEAPTNG